jgi:hypothetical protein
MGAIPRSRLNQFLRKVKSIFDIFVRYLGPFFVVGAVGLICLIMAIHFFGLLPYLAPDILSVSGLILWGSSFYIAFCILFNYYMAVVTPPGDNPLEV